MQNKSKEGGTGQYIEYIGTLNWKLGGFGNKIFIFFISSRTWLEKNPILLATAVYTYLRLLEDHEAAPFKNLRQMEIEFCSSLLREKVPWYIL